jgi:hypothetical protein
LPISAFCSRHLKSTRLHKKKRKNHSPEPFLFPEEKKKEKEPPDTQMRNPTHS